tara:strand:+ start:82 stop:657 length:576 start_codon:yes stop_codon:yes gene_type:complete
MKRIGLTGNIGSGKSTIALCFKILGIPVFNADDEAKFIMNNDSALQDKLINNFGENVFNKNGLNRKYLSRLAFNNIKVLNKLNNLVHPLVRDSFEIWCNQQNSEYVIKEAAILFESNSNNLLDECICVCCPEKIRLRRTLNRGGLSKKEIAQRMSSQWPEKKKKALSNHLIVNDDSCLVMPQILKIHQSLK